MIKAAQKLDALEKLELINVISVPHLKKGSGTKIIDGYKRIVEQDDKVDTDRIKRDREMLLKKLRGKVL